MEVLSSDFSPGLLTPIVASSTRKMSYPPSLILETTSAICSLSANDSLIASPSSFISCFSCWSTSPPEDDFSRLLASHTLDAVTGYPVRKPAGLPVIVTPNAAKIDADDEALHVPQNDHSDAGGVAICRPEPDRECRLKRGSYQRGSLRPRSTPALA